MRFAWFAAACLLVAPSIASARTLTFSDLRKIVTIGDPQISPDGRRAVFTRGVADYGNDRIDSRLMLIDIRTRTMRPLTFDRRGVSTARWSPDGRAIAFLAPAKVAGAANPSAQIFVLRLDGGEARQVTRAPNGVDGYAWSPRGLRFAYNTQDDVPNKAAIRHHLDAFEVGDNDYLHTAAAMPLHLWIVPANGGRARRVTAGSWSLGTVDPSAISELSWSPDGSRIAFVRFPTPLIGDSLAGIVQVVDVRSGRIVSLTGNSGLEDHPAFAPAGNAIAYSRSTNGDPANGNSIYVTRLGGGPGLSASRLTRRTIDGWAWAPSGKAMWLFGPDGARPSAWYAELGGRTRKLNLGALDIVRTGNVAKTGALIFTAAANSRPAELYYLASPSASPQRLTNENAFVRRIDLGAVTTLTWRNDGYTEDGVLTTPPGFRKTHRYPLVLLIHGGPQAASMQGWSSQRQLFAAHGYLVFEPNYRGSTNLGDRYQHAIKFDAGDGPGRDVMAGIRLVERRYPVDRSRIGVSGWSYGGYMTSWMTGHYSIWKTAVAGAALNDWFDDYNVAFYVHTDEPYFGGSPWDPKYTPMWREQSPITYEQHIKTPTLIMGDIGDNNVTITNSFKMYHALKDNGVPVEFVAYPVHGHFPSDPVRSEDVVRRWLGWLDRYLR